MVIDSGVPESFAIFAVQFERISLSTWTAVCDDPCYNVQ